jgi:membrane-associated protease RseP (regulator of RpoE activity)
LSLPLPPAARDPFPLEELREPLLVMLAPPMRRSWWQEWGRNAALFLLTAVSVFLTAGLEEVVGPRGMHLSLNVAAGLKLVAGVMSILFTHEMGHYVACRLHRVDSTLPFFIPAPMLNPLVGTMGAVIRIRSPFPNRKALFDIGIAGPIAGFVVCLPVLVLGVLEARIGPPSAGPGTLSLGDPLLLTWAVSWLRSAPADATVYIGPLGTAAWFGLLVTALNLIPIGQLDGGHVTYAVFGPRANMLSRRLWWVSLALIYFSPSWILWSILLWFLGRRHPPTLDDTSPLERGRLVVALLGLAIFIVCFVPAPITGSWQLWRDELLGSLTSR